MEEVLAALARLGLTESEQEMYLALLRIGTGQKKDLVRETTIAPSKLYEVAARLQKRGLVSVVAHDGIKRFAAAPPVRILSYLDEQREEIDELHETFSALQPALRAMQESSADHEVRVYHGWRGLATAYEEMLAGMRPGEEDLVIGASVGADPERTRTFYARYIHKSAKRRIRIKVLFNESARERYESSDVPRDHITARYLPFHTPTEINIHGDTSLIITLTSTPTVIVIHNKETAASFRTQFDELWKIASR